MIHSSGLREFSSYLENLKNAQENYVISLEKQAAKKLSESKNEEYVRIEKEVAVEDSLSYRIKDTERYAASLQTRTDLREQIADKKFNQEISKAEKLIESLILEQPAPFFENTEDQKRTTDRESLNTLETQKLFRSIQVNKEKLEEKICECVADEQSLLQALQEEYSKQRRKQALLKKAHVQIGLMHDLEHKIDAKEELRNLRTEEDCWQKAEKDKRLEEEKCVSSKILEQKLREAQEKQIQDKKEMEAVQKQRDEEYLTMLMELQGEEECLDGLRLQVRRRKELQHRVAAQEVLEERRRRRKRIIERLKAEEQSQEEYNALREKILEEEEKSLLMSYLPHLGPYLTPTVLSKLSSL